MISIEVVYALPESQRLLTLRVPDDCTVLEAVQRSGITAEFADIDLSNAKLGIFGKVIEQPAQHVLRAGDRIEIYRPLLLDPKAARRQRAAKV